MFEDFDEKLVGFGVGPEGAGRERHMIERKECGTAPEGKVFRIGESAETAHHATFSTAKIVRRADVNGSVEFRPAVADPYGRSGRQAPGCHGSASIDVRSAASVSTPLRRRVATMARSQRS